MLTLPDLLNIRVSSKTPAPWRPDAPVARYKYEGAPWTRMKVSQSFWAPMGFQPRFEQAMRKYGQRNGMKFRVAKERQHGKAGWRVWRIQ